MNTLLYSWARGRSLDHRPVKPLEETEAIRILAPFAYWLHKTKPGGTARRDEIEFKLSELYQEKLKYPAHEAIATAHQFLEDVRQYAGILADRGESQYGFVHLTFEEYLAAREIIFQGQLDRSACAHALLQHVFEASWREVVLLAVDYLSLITNEQEAARMLIESILTSTPPVGSEGLNIVIAGECIADVGLNGAGRECGSRVQKALLQTMIDSAVPLSQRWRAGSLLGTIGDPRFPSNEVSVDLVDVPEGTVKLGSTQEEVDPLIEEVGKVELEPQLEWVRHYWTMTIQSEVPRHSVEVQKFRIGRYPVTNAEYFRFISSNPSQSVPYLDSDRAKPFNWNQELRTYPVSRGNEPVVLVSWRDACLYCEWLSTITGRRFRLTTEAEWELAARGHQGSIYPWGSSWEPTYVNSSEAGAKGLVAVGCYPEGASPFEAFDCAGQVWEWINTRWGDRWRQLRFPYPYRHDDGREISHPCHPTIRPGSGAIPEDLGDWRIVKGGSWDDLGVFARCASRGPNTIDFRSYYIGFRIAESVSEAKE